MGFVINLFQRNKQEIRLCLGYRGTRGGIRTREMVVKDSGRDIGYSIMIMITLTVETNIY